MKTFSKTLPLAAVLLAFCLLLIAPSGAFVPPEGPAAQATPAAPASVTAKPMISVTVSSATPAVGDSVTISGAVSGGNPVSSIAMWVFAGNYIDVSSVPVNPDGSYSKTYQTTGFPPATYYIFVQSPGNDGRLRLLLESSGRYSGQVVDASDGSLLVNFSGTGKVQDAAAATALADALNRRDSDDIYAKTTFRLVAPVAAIASPAAPLAPALPPSPTKSPVSLPAVLAGLGIGVGAIALLSRR